MDDNKSGINKAIHKNKGYGVVFSILLGFALLFIAIPVAAWKSGQKRFKDSLQHGSKADKL